MDSNRKYLIILTSISLLLGLITVMYNAFTTPELFVQSIAYADTSSEITNSSSFNFNTSSLLSSSSMIQSSSQYSSSVQSNSQESNSKKVNINNASAKEIADALNGIGTVISERIVEYRLANGAFRKIEELKNIKGIGDKIFLKIKDYITLE